jgi:hypothetical protein
MRPRLPPSRCLPPTGCRRAGSSPAIAERPSVEARGATRRARRRGRRGVSFDRLVGVRWWSRALSGWFSHPAPPEVRVLRTTTPGSRIARGALGKADLLKGICGPVDARQHVERSENACRFLGFGVPNRVKAVECDMNRATLVGYGELPTDHAHSYRIPLRGCLERVTDPRSLTVTIAWFSPIKPSRQSYRCVRLEAAPLHPPIEVLGVERLKLQPSDATVKRGTIFHEHFHGAKAVPFIDNGHLGLSVWCKEDAGGVENAIRYGIAITIEAEAAIPIYDEIRERLRVAPRP